jgi:hypothetical protein
MRKGSGIPAVDNHLRIPDKLYQKLIDHVKQTKCRSVNRMVVAILAEYFKMKESAS